MSWEVCKVGVAMVKTINFFSFKTDRDVEVLVHGTAQCGSALYSYIPWVGRGAYYKEEQSEHLHVSHHLVALNNFKCYHPVLMLCTHPACFDKGHVDLLVSKGMISSSILVPAC